MINEINEIFSEILAYAERNQECLRKAVGCAAITFDSIERMKPLIVAMVRNGPSRKGFPCTNEVGNCGCSHSEPRLVRDVLAFNEDLPLILVCTYSPCTNCSNIIIDSGLFSGCFYDIFTQHDARGEKFLREAMPVMTRKELNKLTEKEASDTFKKWILG